MNDSISMNVDDVAHLAQLELSSEERVTFSKQFEQILAYLQKLEELDVSGIEPTLHGHGIVNCFREDVPLPSLDHDEAIALAPDSANGEFIMPKIVEDA